MLFRKRNFKYYPEDMDRDDEQMEELSSVQDQLKSLHCKLDFLVKQFQVDKQCLYIHIIETYFWIQNTKTAPPPAVNDALASMVPFHGQPRAQQNVASLSADTAVTSEAVDNVLLRQLPRGDISSDIELEQEEKELKSLNAAPFYRFRQVSPTTCSNWNSLETATTDYESTVK